MGQDLGYQKIVLEGNSKVVIEAIQNKQEDLSEMGNFVEQIHNYVFKFDSFSVLDSQTMK